MSTTSSAAALLHLLDGLLTPSDERIHDSLCALSSIVQNTTHGLQLLPSIPGMYNEEEQQQSNYMIQTRTTTIFSRSKLLQPQVTWTIERRLRRSRSNRTTNNVNFSHMTSNDNLDENAKESKDFNQIWKRQYLLDLCQIIDICLDVCPQLAYNRSSHDGSMALHFASSLGNLAIANVIYHRYPAAATIPNFKGKIPLHYSAREGHIEVVDFFLRLVPGISSIATHKKKLALHFAAGDGHVTVCRALLAAYSRGASVQSSKGKLPLHLCARRGHMAVAHTLIQVFPEGVRVLDWEGNLPLHDASREAQVEMSRYLIELYPMALSISNLRNEIPLFSAIRAENSLDCVALIVQAWPAGCRCILQNISKHDNMNAWMDWPIMELLLRGAVQNLAGCPLLQGKYPPTVRLITDTDWRGIVQPALPPYCDIYHPNKKAKKNTIILSSTVDTMEDDIGNQILHGLSLSISGDQSRTEEGTTTSLTVQFLDFELDLDEIELTTIMRSKSPILEEDFDCKRNVDKKRLKNCTASSSEDYSVISKCKKKFIPLHAALECSASIHVIKYILNERLDFDLDQKDERGMLPLHWAVMQCNRPRLDNTEEREMMIELILNILHSPPPTETFIATAIRDKVYNRLPIHFALLYRADIRIVRALLAANPPSAVDKCDTRDLFYDKTPLYMATHCDCSLDTVYILLRANPMIISSERTLGISKK